MLAVLIYIADTARRMLRKITRSVTIVAESFHEAREFRRKLPRLYMEE
jgi:hypothetical protein